jgi:probable F420-dependent oxidoreductase
VPETDRPSAAFTMFVTADSVQPAELARLVERRGGEALLFPDHTHVPVAPVDGHPAGIRELPPEYARMYDPLIASMAAAAATTRLRIGTAICLINQRDPIATAKQIATLDRLSAGRVVFGVGAGWNAVELANHGVDPAQRFRALRERIEAMTEIWTREEASYVGTTLRFDPLRSGPKPHQQPRPPVLLGGNGPRAPERALAWADGWLPHTEPGGDRPLLTRLTRARRQAPAGFELTLAMAPSNPARLQAFVTAGVDRFLFQLPTGPRQLAEARIERAMGALESLG